MKAKRKVLSSTPALSDDGRKIRGLSAVTVSAPIPMIKVIADGRRGETTSAIPHRDGLYPVWFAGNRPPQFFHKDKIQFVD